MLRADRFQVAHDAEISVCTVPSTRHYRFCLRYDAPSLKFSLGDANLSTDTFRDYLAELLVRTSSFIAETLINGGADAILL